MIKNIKVYTEQKPSLRSYPKTQPTYIHFTAMYTQEKQGWMWGHSNVVINRVRLQSNIDLMKSSGNRKSFLRVYFCEYVVCIYK